jgi:hypothetical protein
MNWIPGWDTAASAGWWSNLWFIVSIGSLALLGISEVISHRYSERKVALVEIAERAATKKHEDDMAELKLEAANSNERAAKADERAAQASERAADANERAAKTELELAKFKAPRVLTPEQIAQLEEELKPVAKIPFDGAIAQLEESTNLFLQISLALQASGGTGRIGELHLLLCSYLNSTAQWGWHQSREYRSRSSNPIGRNLMLLW